MITRDIDFFVGSTDRCEEILCEDAVWTVVLSIESERHMLEIVNRDRECSFCHPARIPFSCDYEKKIINISSDDFERDFSASCGMIP